MWGCQVLGWTTPQTLTCKTQDGTILHLLESPEHFWRLAAAQSWVDYCIKHARMKAELRPSHISWLSFKSLASQKPFKESSLALKCRTLGVLSGSALATIHNLEASCCEFCHESEAGQMHLVLRCSKVRLLGDEPRFSSLKDAPVFTRAQAYLHLYCHCVESRYISRTQAFPAIAKWYTSLPMALPTHLLYPTFDCPPGVLLWPIPFMGNFNLGSQASLLALGTPLPMQKPLQY